MLPISPDPNVLSREKSPYLLQHANNPVWWYPWGDDAFKKAQKESKPIFLSIGYSTCHWCHVMAHESFENVEIAGILNQNFVSIKVDREERPDIDNIYMKAVQALTGSGGWPLSVFLTPDLKPFYGGTYFPPESQWGRPGFKELLFSIQDAWRNRQTEILRSSDSITHDLQAHLMRQNADDGVTPDRATLTKAYTYFTQTFDKRYGGFGSAPKFPSGHILSFLLRYGQRFPEAKALAMVEKTLTAMAEGGIYDHIGGGFHRYATDQHWLVPHFEKMLYDQAILSKTYLEAYQVTKNEKYAQTARAVFDYVLRDMTDVKGGFYSAEDADSLPPEKFIGKTLSEQASHHKTEGAFYLWDYKEINEILGEEQAAVFNFTYDVKSDGNVSVDPHGEFRGKNIINTVRSLSETAEMFHKTSAEVTSILEESRKKLFGKRALRPKPHLDDKILTDWNGLMISSLAFGSRVLNDPTYKEAAQKAADFILAHLIRTDGRLLHRYRDGDAGILGTIEDYAFFIHGLIDLYEATFHVRYLKEAQRLTGDMIKLFWDYKNGGFYFVASDAEKLLFNEKEIYDGAAPSGNALAVLDLLRMGRLTLNKDWEDKAAKLFKTFGQGVSAMPSAHTQTLTALDFVLGPSCEIVLVGAKDSLDTASITSFLFNRFMPNKVVVFRSSDDDEARALFDIVPFIRDQRMIKANTTVYVCKDYSCERPTDDLETFRELLDR